MKLFTLLLALILGLLQPAFSQSIPNAGFENWTPSGKPAPFDWLEPSGWKTSNGTTEFIGATVLKSTVKQAGALSCQIRTVNIFDNIRAGVLALGSPALDYGNYSVVHEQAGIPFTERPVALNGYYMHESISNGNGMGVCLLKKWNAAAQRADTIGYGSALLPDSDDFIPFSIPLVYQSDEAPDSVAIFFYSSDPGSLQSGSFLRLDELSFGPITSIIPLSSANISLYPNPSSGRIHLDVPADLRIERILITDLSGKHVLDQNKPGDSIDTGFEPGIYFYRLYADGATVLKSGKLIVRQ